MLALPLLLVARVALAAQGYDRLAEERGVTVYRRHGASGIDLAAEGDIAAPPERVRAVLLDYARHPAFVDHLAESRVLERGPDWLLVYQRLDLPVIDDRDFTLKVSWGEEDGALFTRFAAANALGPAARRGVVRVPVHEGGWILEPRDGGRATHARYWFRMDLGGSLPRWLGRGRAGSDVSGLFEAIRRQAR